jgi:hypothetical protein
MPFNSPGDGDDTFTKTDVTSWGSRLLSSITGVLVGLVLFLAAFPLLFWNEGRAVRAARGLAEGRGAVVSVAADKVEPGSEGKLIHFTGRATTEERPRDPLFGVTDNVLRLVREVEMYQWVEDKETKSEKQTGGSTKQTTTYRYSRQWRKEAIASDKFEQKAGHTNPGSMAVPPESWQASVVRVGAFSLPGGLVAELPGRQPLAPVDLPASSQHGPLAKAKAWRDGYYIGDDPDAPKIGDLKVRFLAAPPMDVSVVGRQIGGSVAPYLAKTGTEVLRIETGLVPADIMFKHAASENALLTWLLRAGGFLAMFIGLGLIFRPLVTLADVLPILGSILGVGAGLAALALSAPLTLITVGLAWLAYRPLVGGAALAAALGVFLLFGRLGRGRRAAAAARPSAG